MRNFLLIVALTALSMAPAASESLAPPKPSRTATYDKPLPAKHRGGFNACAAYGPGFVKVDGSDTCVKLGGAISVGVSGGR
jgi:hypothetical protein